ncbi:MAG TPA: hypothetical protein PLK31_23070, partial [Chloroflexota bacterium]|nr:hypothetical protein [Chloroflexota bacterium]
MKLTKTPVSFRRVFEEESCFTSCGDKIPHSEDAIRNDSLEIGRGFTQMNADFFKILSAFIRVYPRPILFLLLWILAACTEQEARPIAQTISHTAVPTPT